jgi:hypothetical protein
VPARRSHPGLAFADALHDHLLIGDAVEERTREQQPPQVQDVPGAFRRHRVVPVVAGERDWLVAGLMELPHVVTAVRDAHAAGEHGPVRPLAHVEGIEPAVLERLPVDRMILVSQLTVQHRLGGRARVVLVDHQVVGNVLRAWLDCIMLKSSQGAS